MLARTIARYSRPRRPDDALRALARGARALGGGTRLLATDTAYDEIVDLAALGWDAIEAERHGLRLGASVRLQQLADSRLARERSGGLLGEACRAQSASPLLRAMATLGGETAAAPGDAPLHAALLALGARALLLDGSGERACELEELPGPGEWLLRAIAIPEPPSGAALERIAVLPSAPSLVVVAAALWMRGATVARARLGVAGLAGPPSRARAAERRLEGREPVEEVLDAAARALADELTFRDDAHAAAAWRRRVSASLARRALRGAVHRAQASVPPPPVRRWMEEPGPSRPLGAALASASMELELNGRRTRLVASAGTTLMELLRGEGLNGVKHGCETGECGACCVLVDGRPVASCLTLALSADGHRVETVEAMGSPDALHPIQQAFVDTGAIQCGYCTPALELCARALLRSLPRPGEREVRDALAGCLCRCTGYVKPVEAVLAAAESGRAD